MNKTAKITVIILSVLLVSLCTIAATYSVIIEVSKNEGLTEIINEIHIKDLLTDDNGNYNSLYYDLKNELSLTDTEANILISSKEIDISLQKVLKSIVNYKVNNDANAKLTDTELYNLISETILNINNISDQTKSRIINKASIYRKDISKYVYDIEVSVLEDLIWFI